MTEPGNDTIATILRGLEDAVSQQLEDALTALGAGDAALADRVVRRDVEINRVRYSAEEGIASELRDGAHEERLRFLIAALYVISDLERIADHAEGIARVALMLGSPPGADVPGSLLEMGQAVIRMFRDGVATFHASDPEAARLLCLRDDEIDAMYDSLYAELLAGMTSDADSVVPRTYLLWATHNLERIADRVTNVCERTVYLTTGRVEELNVSNN